MFNNLVDLEVVIIDYPMTMVKVDHVDGSFEERSMGYFSFEFELVSPSSVTPRGKTSTFSQKSLNSFFWAERLNSRQCLTWIRKSIGKILCVRRVSK